MQVPSKVHVLVFQLYDLVLSQLIFTANSHVQLCKKFTNTMCVCTHGMIPTYHKIFQFKEKKYGTSTGTHKETNLEDCDHT